MCWNICVVLHLQLLVFLSSLSRHRFSEAKRCFLRQSAIGELCLFLESYSVSFIDFFLYNWNPCVCWDIHDWSRYCFWNLKFPSLCGLVVVLYSFMETITFNYELSINISIVPSCSMVVGLGLGTNTTSVFFPRLFLFSALISMLQVPSRNAEYY